MFFTGKSPRRYFFGRIKQMNKVKVLIQGYAKKIKGGWLASSTVTFVQSGGKNVVVDPGCNRKRLLEELEDNGLKPGDVDFVLQTHNHTDHTLLTGVFEKAKVLNTDEIYDGDNQVEHKNKIPDTDLEIIQTPGHAPEHCSLVINTPEGVYVVAGDAFWWMDNEEQEINVEKEDQAHPEEADMRKLIESRKKVLKIADYIIPGHGKMVKILKREKRG